VEFAPFEADVEIALRYAPGDELASLARRHLEAVARPLSPAEFQARFDALMAVIGSHPDLGVNLQVHDATLTLPLPELEVVPPPDPDGDGGGSGGGGGGPGPEPEEDPGPTNEPIPTDDDPAPFPLPRPEPPEDRIGVPTRPGRRPPLDEEAPVPKRRPAAGRTRQPGNRPRKE
jgi:hypothetical protein